MADDKLVERLRYAAKPHQSSPLERDTLLAQAADRIEALEAAAKPLSEWFHLHYPVKWEHGGGLKLDRALGADR